MKESKYFLLLVIALIFFSKNAKELNTIALKEVHTFYTKGMYEKWQKSQKI
jgi:hypothetical protein